jgi:hypothetical protein
VFFALLTFTTQTTFKEEFNMSQRELAIAISRMQRRNAAKNRLVIITGSVSK